MTKVSVIIPVYNAGKYLRECLDSAAGQTMRDIEIICVDDGSTDSSPAILAEYAGKDPRFVIVTKANGGSASARNAGLAKAKGDYILFCDDDDIIRNDTCGELFAAAGQDNLDIVYTVPDILEETGTEGLYGKRFTDILPEQTSVSSGRGLFTSLMENGNYSPAPWRRLIRRKTLEALSLTFMEDAAPHEDNIFSFILDLSAPRAAALQKHYYTHRSHENSTMIKIKRGENTGPNITAHMLCAMAMSAFLSTLKPDGAVSRMAEQRINNVMWTSVRIAMASGVEDIDSLDWRGHDDARRLFASLMYTAFATEKPLLKKISRLGKENKNLKKQGRSLFGKIIEKIKDLR